MWFLKPPNIDPSVLAGLAGRLVQAQLGSCGEQLAGGSREVMSGGPCVGCPRVSQSWVGVGALLSCDLLPSGPGMALTLPSLPLPTPLPLSTLRTHTCATLHGSPPACVGQGPVPGVQPGSQEHPWRCWARSPSSALPLADEGGVNGLPTESVLFGLP